MWKRVLALLMSVIMVATMFVGCSKENAKTEGGEVNSKSAEVSAEKTKKKLHVVVDGNLINFPKGMNENDNFIIRGMEDYTGYDLEWTILPNANGENITKLNSMMSAGNAGDIISMRDCSLMGRYSKEKLIVPLDDYLGATNNLNDDKTPDAIKLLTTVNGKRYAVSTENALPGTTSTLIRKDWMEKLGLSQPKNKDELYSTLVALRNADIDGNGTADTTPLAVCGDCTISQTFFLLRGLFDMPNDFQIKNGKVVYTWIEDEGKQFLEYAAKLYADKLIPSDFAALNDQSVQDMLMSGKSAMLTDWPWASRNNIPAMAEKHGGDLRFIENPKSISGITAQSQTQTPLAMTVMVTKFSKSPEDAVSFLDKILDDKMITLTNYGIEGETFNYIDGKPVFNEEVTSGKKDMAWNVYFANELLQTPDIWHYQTATLQGWGEYYYTTELNVGKIYPADVMMPVQPDLISMKTDLASQVSVYCNDFIMGKENADTFTAFREKWLKDGGQEILDGYNKLYEDLGKPVFDHPQTNKTREGFTGKYMYNGSK